MLIREVEKLTGIKDVNIRYYEKEGLIHPERRSNGYREYSQEDIQRIRQIKTLRLLDIPVPLIKSVLAEEISLKEVMKYRLSEINEEEARIKEIKNSCEAIISKDLNISSLNEEVLYGSHTAWKARLEEIMKQDINKSFIGKACLYTICWAILAKLTLTAALFTYTSEGSGAESFGRTFVKALNLHELDIEFSSIYFICAAGLLLLLYGIGLSIFEGLSGKGFLWVWAANWGGGGLGGLGNSFAICGIGSGLLGITIPRFIALLLCVCILLTLIRGLIMYLKSSRRDKPAPKTGRVVAVTALIGILLFALGIFLMRNDYISKYPTLNKEETSAEYTDGTVLEITINNWKDYFDLVESTAYEKNDSGEITSVHQDAWFALKEEYWEQIDQNAPNDVSFSCVADMKLKQYEITDTRTGEYKITKDGPKGLAQTSLNVHLTYWNPSTNGIDEEVPLIDRYTGSEKYLYTYEKINVKGANGKVYLKRSVKDE